MKIRSRSSNVWVYVLVGALGVLTCLLIIGYLTLLRLTTVADTALVLTPEAYTKQWLAISKLGNYFGISVHSDSQLDPNDMPAPTDTVILDGDKGEVDEQVSKALESWVLGGGTLIFRVPKVHHGESLHRVIAARNFPNTLSVYERDATAQISDSLLLRLSREKRACSPDTLPIHFPYGDVAEHEWRSSPDLVWNESPYANEIVSLSQSHFLSLTWGQGQVYFVTDLDLWSNHFAECADNAYVFLRLVLGSGDLNTDRTNETSVWILSNPLDTVPSLLSLIWSNYYTSIIGILITFLVALVAFNIRSSPPIHAVPIPRRATIDYVTSVSEFAWRKKSIERFFQALVWLSADPKRVLGPRAGTNITHQSNQTHVGNTESLILSPQSEEDMIDSVRKLQAKLRQNLQPSLRN